jgi:hypothetical protein
MGYLHGYLLAFPNATQRHEHLTAVGHGSFHAPGLLAVAVTGLSLVVLSARTLRSEDGIPGRENRPPPRLAAGACVPRP